MRKILSILIAIILLTQVGYCLNSYFFLTSTSGQGTIDDPAAAICSKYSVGKSQIYYGDNVGVCAIECETDPDITEIVLMKSRTQIINLTHPNLVGFNGTTYIYKWEHPNT